MDKIWDRKSFEVGGHWPHGTDKSQTLKKNKKYRSNDRIVFG